MARASKIPATYNNATKMSGRFISGLPKSADPPHEPKHEQADNCARSINHYIRYPSFPVWDKQLMDFIARRVQCDEQHSETRIRPAPRARVIANRFAQCPPNQDGQHSVFS